MMSWLWKTLHVVSEEVDLKMQAFSEEKVSEFALDQFFSCANNKNLAGGMVTILLMAWFL